MVRKGVRRIPVPVLAGGLLAGGYVFRIVTPALARGELVVEAAVALFTEVR